MGYRVKVVLLAIGVAWGFGHGIHHMAKKRMRLGPDIHCPNPAAHQQPAPSPENPQQP